MADVFVSYATEDRERVKPVVETIERAGFSVWWDRRIAPGAGFDAVIQDALDKARCVLVIWSKHSVTSEWVITEASDGLERGILVPISIDAARPPLAFRRRQTIAVGSGKSDLEQITAAVRGVLEGEAVEFHRVEPNRAGRKTLVIAGLVAGALVGAVAGQMLIPSDGVELAPPTVLRTLFPLDGWEDYWADPTFLPSLTMSTDGTFVVYVARDDRGTPRLRRRQLESLESTDIEGTEGGIGPFLSPNGQWVGFFIGTTMLRVPIEGGTPSTITMFERNRDIWGASWGEDDRIVYAEGRSGLQSVPASGGQSQWITELDHSRFQGSHRLPHHVPASRLLLYSVFIDSGEKATRHEIWVLDLDTGTTKFLTDGVVPHYVSSGHIVYAMPDASSRGSLWAVAFDKDAINLTDAPVALQSGVAGREGSAFALGMNSALVYMPEQGGVSAQVILREPDGSERAIGTGGFLDYPAMSNAGDAVAFGGWNYGGNEDTIRIYRLKSGAVSRIARGSIPLWGPDDTSMTYVSRGRGIVRQQLDGEDSQEMLVSHQSNIFPQQWLDNGKTLLFNKVESGKASAIDAYTLIPGESPVRIQRGQSSVAVSANGDWIADCTWPAGVYVSDYPALRSRTLVSPSGCFPKWGPRDGLIYYQDVNKLWSVDIAFDDGVVLGDRRLVADLGLAGSELYDVHRSGRLVYVHHKHTKPGPPVVISGWQQMLQPSPE